MVEILTGKVHTYKNAPRDETDCLFNGYVSIRYSCYCSAARSLAVTEKGGLTQITFKASLLAGIDCHFIH